MAKRDFEHGSDESFATPSLITIEGSVSFAAETHTELIQQAEELAAQLDGLDSSDEQRQELANKIKALVTQSFDQRQQTQAAQIEKMMKQLQEAKSRIDQRNSLKDRIIARKVEDIISGQSAQWNAGRASTVFDTIAVGDTIMIHLLGVIPMQSGKQPPQIPEVRVLGSGRIVMGMPPSQWKE